MTNIANLTSVTMKTSRGKNFDVFDFKEEDAFPETVARNFCSKFRNEGFGSSRVAKYKPLEHVDRGTRCEALEQDDVKCGVNFSHTDRDNEVSFCSALDSRVRSSQDASSNSVSVVGENSLNNGVYGIHRGADNKPEDRACDPETSVPSEEHDCSTRVGENSVGTPSISSSDIASENVCPCERASTDDELINTDVGNHKIVLSPDYIMFQGKYCTRSVIIFSPNCIQIRDPDVSCSQTCDLNLGIDDIICIESQWHRMVETAIVKISAKYKKVVGEADGLEDLKFAVVDANWSQKQDEILSLDVKYKAIWKLICDASHGTRDNFSPSPYFPIFKPFEDVVYPKGDSDAVSISKRDVDLLEPHSFLNDTIVDFYIKYLKNKIQPQEMSRFHFFNSFFFRKLADMDKNPANAFDGRAAFLRVRKWTRKVNIFEKDYVFIPVNFNFHWSLIVICHPGETATFDDDDLSQSLKVPCILHLDSINGGHTGIKDTIQSYLWEEWKERKKETCDDMALKFFNMRFVSLELPQQENSFDCGLFLLHYAELFLEDAPAAFNPFCVTKFSNFLNANWFHPWEASLKRAHIRRLIYDLLEDHTRKSSPTDCAQQHCAHPLNSETCADFAASPFLEDHYQRSLNSLPREEDLWCETAMFDSMELCAPTKSVEQEDAQGFELFEDYCREAIVEDDDELDLLEGRAAKRMRLAVLDQQGIAGSLVGDG